MKCDQACYYHCTKDGTQKTDCMNYNDYIEYLEANKIGYHLKREKDHVIVSSEEGDKKFNFKNQLV